MKARASSPVAVLRLTALFCASLASAALANAAPPLDGDLERPGTLTDAAAADQASTELVEHHRHHHHGGVTKFIAMSLDTLGVAPGKQAKVDRIQADLYACMVPARDLENGLLATLADGVGAGQVEVAKVDAAIAQLEGATPAIHACSGGPLNRLHSALSPAERSTLIDKVQAHWNVWRLANGETDAGGRDKGSRLADLTDELSLTSDQADRASASLLTALAPLRGQFDPKSVDAQVAEFSSTFTQKSFDARKLTVNASGKLATYGAKRMALFYETIAPLLTPEQRALLAQHLREHANLQFAGSGK